MLFDSHSDKTPVDSSPSRFIFPDSEYQSTINIFLSSFCYLMLSDFLYTMQSNSLGFRRFREASLASASARGRSKIITA